ncbi:uncharacterized protein LOC110710849 [Chenopodium quinoa]|uniref:uncharacterized protein LOC110710849 n=1 Tax=Chenopodium quinoa TaxID=63459 RepID=UPI000B788FF6|nr:uncharacterized protein LOC110710849 [Chenopodium quinoa]
MNYLKINAHTNQTRKAKGFCMSNEGRKKIVLFRNRMVPFVLLHTSTLTVKVKPTRPVGGFPEQLKGVLAIIQPIKKGENHAVTIQLVTASTAATWIAKGQRPSGDLLLLKKNSVTPVNLPDLSDLALLPLALKIAIQKKLKEEGGVQGIGLEHVIPECVANIVDSPSILPTVMETCNLNAGRHKMEINSYLDDLNIFTTSSTLRLNEVYACWELLSGNPLDGRKVTLDFNIVKCHNNVGGARVLV